MPRVLFVVLAFGCSGSYEPEPLLSPTSSDLSDVRVEQFEALRSVDVDFTVLDRSVPLAIDEHVAGVESSADPVLSDGGRDYVREWAAVALRRA